MWAGAAHPALVLMPMVVMGVQGVVEQQHEQERPRRTGCAAFPASLPRFFLPAPVPRRRRASNSNNGFFAQYSLDVDAAMTLSVTGFCALSISVSRQETVVNIGSLFYARGVGNQTSGINPPETSHQDPEHSLDHHHHSVRCSAALYGNCHPVLVSGMMAEPTN
ncbi:hypothetical protein C8J57DRAFT_1301701, partial [Mycena rebaudengoi]